jgi:excisionase family DNA binding protein
MKTAGRLIQIPRDETPSLPVWAGRLKEILVALVDLAARELTSSQSGPSLAEPTLEPKELAALLKIPESTVLELARRGELPCFRLGKHVRFDRAEVAEALARRRS